MYVIAHGSCANTVRVWTESWLWEKHPLPHWGIEPVSVLRLAFQPDVLPPKLFKLLFVLDFCYWICTSYTGSWLIIWIDYAWSRPPNQSWSCLFYICMPAILVPDWLARRNSLWLLLMMVHLSWSVIVNKLHLIVFFPWHYLYQAWSWLTSWTWMCFCLTAYISAWSWMITGHSCVFVWL